MMSQSIEPRDQTFVKGYGFLYFAKNMGKHFCNILSNNLSGKYCHNLLDTAGKSVADTDEIETSLKTAIQLARKTTGDLFGNIAIEKNYKRLQK